MGLVIEDQGGRGARRVVLSPWLSWYVAKGLDRAGQVCDDTIGIPFVSYAPAVLERRSSAPVLPELSDQISVIAQSAWVIHSWVRGQMQAVWMSNCTTTHWKRVGNSTRTPRVGIRRESETNVDRSEATIDWPRDWLTPSARYGRRLSNKK